MPARILLIEDNFDNLDLMTYLLTAFGYTILKVMNGEEGLELAQREKPDLILCDLQLPRLDGFEVVKQIRRDPELLNVPVVAVTASAMPEDLQKVVSAGFNGYLTKPIDSEQFVRQVEAYLRDDLRSGGPPESTL